MSGAPANTTSAWVSAVQVVSSEGIANTAALSAAIEAAVRCLYEERIAAVIAAYPLPELDIGSLGISGVGPGTTLGIVAPAITRTEDYFVLTGSVEAR